MAAGRDGCPESGSHEAKKNHVFSRLGIVEGILRRRVAGAFAVEARRSSAQGFSGKVGSGPKVQNNAISQRGRANPHSFQSFSQAQIPALTLTGKGNPN